MSELNRRSALRHLGHFATGAAAVSCFLPPLQDAFGQEVSLDKPDEASLDAWMKTWLARHQAGTEIPGGMLLVGRFADPMYFVYQPIGWKPNPGQEGLPAVEVPSGFVTDFASIPRLFWSMLRPDGDYVYAAIIHDYMYWSQQWAREVADDVFRKCMDDFGIASVISWPIYQAVRGAGVSAWNANAKLQKAGEKRILQEFPKDPTIRWTDWKKNPGVFRK